MKVCLRFCDNAVLLMLPDEMIATGATAFIHALAFLFNLITTNCGLCGKMQSRLKWCMVLLGIEQTIVRRRATTESRIGFKDGKTSDPASYAKEMLA
jgi:hypothetical protein